MIKLNIFVSSLTKFILYHSNMPIFREINEFNLKTISYEHFSMKPYVEKLLKLAIEHTFTPLIIKPTGCTN